MSAILVLTPEELDIVRFGGLDEPGYRPHPRRERRLELAEERAAELEGREVRDVTRTTRHSFTRMVSAQYWTRHGTTLVYLLTPPSADVASSVVGLARATGGPRAGVGDGSRNLVVGPWSLVDEPISMSDIEALLTSRHREWLSTRLSGRFRELQRTLADAVAYAVRSSIPGYDEIVSDLTRPDLRRRPREQLERRDATATALSLSTPRWRSLRPVANPELSRLVDDVDNALRRRVSENDMVEDDSDIFEDWQRAGRSSYGWREFRHGKHRMLIKNVNFNYEEHDTGADLVYVRTNPDAVVLVQYKMLDYRSDGVGYIQIDDRLRGQISRMLSFDKKVAPSKDGGPEDYRLGSAFTFVKLVERPPEPGLESNELTRGWYLTADYVQNLLDSGVTGPRGGSSMDIDPERAISSPTFTDLVRKTWVGSTSDATRALHDLLQPRSSSMTIAVHETVTTSS